MPFLGSREFEESSGARGWSMKLRPLGEVLRDRDHGWGPLLWVLYLGFFFVQPVAEHVSGKQWFLDGVGAAIFLVLYWGIFLLERPRPLVHVGGMVLLGLLYVPFNPGGCTFFIFAAAMVPFLVNTQRKAIVGLGIVGTIAAIEGLLLHVGAWELFWLALFPVFIGGGNVFFAERNRMNRKLRKANQEIENLAKIAERERIARDLHDVLGHTLSVIILKSELARELIDRDPQRAKAEIADVEQTSRAALADVRSTIRGYRSHSLETELKQAKATLETAGVVAKSESAEVRLTPAQE